MYIENIDHFVHEEKIEDTNEVARSHKSKDKQHNGQMKKDKQHNVHPINLITLSKPSTQILTRATSKSILL
jgi:hypothetical protein